MAAEHQISPNRVPDLSDRQRECLRLLWRGHGAKGIARELHLSVETVNAHLKSARRILKVNRSTDAARILAEVELTDRSESMVTHELGIAERPLPVPSTWSQPTDLANAEEDGDEVREPSGTELIAEADISTSSQSIRGRFDDLTAPHRTLTIVLAMLALVVILAGLASIASSLQTMLWAIVLGR